MSRLSSIVRVVAFAGVVGAAAGGGLLLDKAAMWRAERDSLLRTAALTPGRDGHSSLTVLLLGDSIFERFPWRALFSNRFDLQNFGVAENSIGQIAARYHRIAVPPTSDIVVVEGGINNLLGANIRGDAEITTVERVVAKYREILADAADRGSAAVLFGVLPVTSRFLLPHTRSVGLPTTFDVAKVNRMVAAVNANLRMLAAKPQVTYCDVASAVAGTDGEFRRLYAAPDGYHVNVFGYQALAAELEKCLEGLRPVTGESRR